MQSKNQRTNDTNFMAIVKATYTKSRGGAKAAIRYISHRPGREGEKVKRELFGSDGKLDEEGQQKVSQLDRQEAYQMIDAAEEGTAFFRFVISPDQRTEDTQKDLHLQAITEQTMLALEGHLNKPVPYVAAVHDDHTELRHVHLVACITSRLGKEHFKTMRDTATDTALMQRQERDSARQQQQEGGQWAGQGIS
jgi:hypothetical protein